MNKYYMVSYIDENGIVCGKLMEAENVNDIIWMYNDKEYEVINVRLVNYNDYETLKKYEVGTCDWLEVRHRLLGENLRAASQWEDWLKSSK